ncbi:hypothetical protein MF672_040445 [Actinomadura sp. ATCC 31491]|uniref:Uncharacterized protein n=1 Tax=Actinomadura luzonensis TaxID=2805427 RepID=A0ABT0G5Y1_9ACTN|nr:hypothetical protein [Actinomadura luzonensis]MCK2220024.1 hypothetical protein [Actinomadura luzonensis]
MIVLVLVLGFVVYAAKKPQSAAQTVQDAVSVSTNALLTFGDGVGTFLENLQG